MYNIDNNLSVIILVQISSLQQVKLELYVHLTKNKANSTTQLKQQRDDKYRTPLIFICNDNDDEEQQQTVRSNTYPTKNTQRLWKEKLHSQQIQLQVIIIKFIILFKYFSSPFHKHNLFQIYYSATIQTIRVDGTRFYQHTSPQTQQQMTK